MPAAFLTFLHQRLIPPHQLGHAGAFGGALHRHAVSVHDGAVVLLVSAAQLGRHGHFVVQVGKAGVRVEGASVQNSLRGLLNLGLLRVGGRGPGEVVVDRRGITIVTLL